MQSARNTTSTMASKVGEGRDRPRFIDAPCSWLPRQGEVITLNQQNRQRRKSKTLARWRYVSMIGAGKCAAERGK
jgi:hypothetical protein